MSGAELRAAAWSVDLILTAAGGCSGWFLFALVAVAALGLAGILVPAGSARGKGGWSVAFTLAGILAWAFRDRLLLLADSRLWIHSTQALSDQVPLYRAPLAARILDRVGHLGSDPAVSLAALSVAGGLGLAGLLAGSLRGNAGGTGPGPYRILALVFAAPLSFVFFGHIETYALFAVALAAFLAAVGRDLRRGRVSLATPALLLILTATHLLGAWMILPVAAAARRGARRPGAGLTFGIGLALLVLTMLAVPALRDHTLLAMSWSPGEILTYLGDTVNGWVLVLIPGGALAFRARRELRADPFGRFLAWSALTYLVLPLLAVFELGIYRDLDLFTPAFVSILFLGGLSLVKRPPSAKVLGSLLLPGALILGAELALTLCPAGATFFDRQLAHGAMTSGGRAYGYEILAYHHLDRGDPATGVAGMRAALRATPGNHRLYGPLGEMQLAQEDTAGALESLERSMSTPRAPKTAPLLAELYTRLGEPQQAIDLLDPRRDTLLDDPRAAAALAVAYFRVGLPESTVAVARARLHRDPTDAIAHFNAASGLATLGRWKDAEAAMRAALLLDPENLPYHRRLLGILVAQPDGESRAREYLDSLPPPIRTAIDGR